ncbi:hypothetical protein NQ318_003418 [Aromia moschata]|uniref:Vps16 C-terminal domain-containing protein n=1 Tax=Aromia moschata TaxID=1265417 RepID=A0AAV8YTK6_9CUCU|nr:hypothetical protein NQ318_003418 [Aromia moschata]
MASKNEDDFGIQDLSQSFNELVFSSVTEESSVLPIFSVLSKTSLDLVLDDIKSVNEYVVPPWKKSLKKCSTDKNTHWNDKLLLLDSALETMDGNIIISVILFLKSTLKQNIFFHQLSKRKSAVRHYANYLIINGQFQQLADLYMATGNNANMKQVYYLIGRDVTSKDVLYKRLEQFMVEHMPKVNNNEDKSELFENMHLLPGCALQKEWEKNKNSNEAIMDFKKRLKVDDFGFEWTILNVMASMQLWPQLTATFIKPNWLTKKNTLKTVMNPEIFVYGLSRHKPPKDVLEQYLACISDSEKSLYLAQKLNCHKFVIQHYINQRDRLALIGYKAKVTAPTEEYFLIENALQSTDKKWKN